MTVLYCKQENRMDSMKLSEMVRNIVEVAVQDLKNIAEQSDLDVLDIVGWDGLQVEARDVPTDAHFDAGRSVGLLTAVAAMFGVTIEELLRLAGPSR
jgi:ABC-type glucose/galactose transport system permease subunit